MPKSTLQDMNNIIFMEIARRHNISAAEIEYTLNSDRFKDIIVWLESINPKSSIFEIGCGCGALLSRLQYLGFENAVGIDLGKEKLYVTLEYLRTLGQTADLINADAHHLPFRNEAFDVVVIHDVLYSPKVRFNRVLRELYRVLASRGYFWFDVYNALFFKTIGRILNYLFTKENQRDKNMFHPYVLEKVVENLFNVEVEIGPKKASKRALSLDMLTTFLVPFVVFRGQKTTLKKRVELNTAQEK